MSTETWLIWIGFLSIAAVGWGVFPRSGFYSSGRLLLATVLISFGMSGWASSLMVVLVRST